MKNLIYISHRGNINGKNPEMENHPDYIQKALDLGYDVEVDVWVKGDKFYLGHDEPKYEINKDFLKERYTKLWCHAKNIYALNALLELSHSVNCFWHQNDDYTLTKFGFIWVYPNKKLIKSKDKKLISNSIAVLPELYPDWDISKAIGICSDFIANYKK